MSTTGNADRYRERLSPTALGWALAPGLGVSTWFLFGIFGQLAAIIAGVIALLVTAVLLYLTSTVLRVTGGPGPARWHAGRATIPVSLLGAPETLDVEAMRAAMGPDLLAQAYVCHRVWVRTGVRVPVQDPADPTPYWLVATRNPDRLARVLVEAGAQAAHSEHTG